ncbi:helix-turn-helix domain-containing protein [Haloarculaceae archaeon H-GB1-1]|nr:helix-turn-helix domain-containing protein [Haloarculaceae archaeon H-GB1-1]
MITATLKVHAGDGWVAAIGDYDVVGQGIAWSFRDRQFIGITALDAARSDFHDVVETIREHDVTEWLDVIERYDTEDGRTLGSIITKCTYTSYTPWQIVSLEGFLPIGYAEYSDGYEYLDIFARDPDGFSDAVEALEFDTAEVVEVTPGFVGRPQVSLLEWQRIVEAISEAERDLLQLALDERYYEVPRETSLAGLASRAGVAKSTASKRLRAVEREFMPFIVNHLRSYAHSAE